MNHLGRAAILLVLGVMTVRLVRTGGFGWFLAQHMRIPLLLAGIVMLILGVAEYFASVRIKSGAAEPITPVCCAPATAAPVAEGSPLIVMSKSPLQTEGDHDHDHEHGHDHHHDDDHEDEHVTAGPRVGWLLIAPLAVLIAVAPTGLGAAAADRVDAIIPTDTGATFEALPVSDQPVELGVLEFLNRAVWDDQRSLADVRVKLTGLVVNDTEIPDGFKLTKFLVGCCAADGLPVQVVVRGATQPLTNDTWVEVTGEWIEPDTDAAESGDTPEIMAESIAILPSAPTNPYESW